MNNYIDAYALKEQVSIVDLLAYMGYRPVNSSGGKLKYHSMLREGDSDPSFFVYPKTNEWHDFGLPGGGDIISFGRMYWKNLNFYQVLCKIKEIGLGQHSTLQYTSQPRQPRPRIAERVPNYAVIATKPLGNNPILEEYLKSRAIWDVANHQMAEIYYRVTDEHKNVKKFFAIGWQNENLAWEVRTAHGWKGCLGKKGLSVIPGDPDKAVLFEGFPDYLSWLKLTAPENFPTVIVTNTTALVGLAAKQVSGYSEVTCYFDNDRSGREATDALIQEIPYAIDGAERYRDYNDYNEMLMAMPQQKMPWEEDHVFAKIMQTYKR